MENSQVYGNMSYNNQGLPPKPDNNLALSVISAILCQVFGIIALVMSMQSDTCYRNGDYEGAVQKAKSAKTFAWVGIIATGAFIVLWLLSFILPFLFSIFVAIVGSAAQ